MICAERVARRRAMRVAVIVASIAWATAVAAQSDGSMEQAYAQHCQKDATSQFCNVLREAMPKSSKSASLSDAQSQFGDTALWGPIAGREGWWQGSNGVWSIQRARDRKQNFFGKISEGAEAYRLTFYQHDGNHLWQQFHIIRDSKTGDLRFSLLEDSGKAPRLPEGGVFLDNLDHAFVDRGSDTFELVAGRMKGGKFVPGSVGVMKEMYGGRFSRLSEADAKAFKGLVQQRQVEAANAVAQRKAQQGGDSGLFGALAMATGAALAGGNAEVVMGAAMKGAEMTTDSEGTRQMLAGQGDAMIADGVQRMAQQNLPRQMPSPGSAMGSSSSASATTPSSADVVGQMSGRPAAAATGDTGGPPIRFYYIAGMVPTAQDTRNPVCVSNVVTLTERLGSDPWGRRDRAAPHVEPYRASFIEKCRRLGEITSLGDLYYTVEGVDSGWPYPSFHPTDRRVTLP